MTKKQKLKYILYGVWITLLSLFLLWLWIVFIYKTTWFSEKWEQKIKELYNKKIKTIKIKIKQDKNLQNKINKQSFEIKKYNKHIMYIWVNDWIVYFDNIIDLSILLNSNNYPNKEVYNFTLKSFYIYCISKFWSLDLKVILQKFSWRDFINTLISNLIKQDKIKVNKNILNKLQNNLINKIDNQKKSLLNYLNNTSVEDKQEAFAKFKKHYQSLFWQVSNQFKKKLNNLNTNFCYYDFCWIKNKEIKTIYNYIKQSIYVDKDLQKYLFYYSKQFNISIKVPLSVLFIENIRIHTTYKWQFKRFLMYNTPKLSIMSKFSYWLFGIKLKSLDFIINNKYRWYLSSNKNYILKQITRAFYNYKNWKYTRKEWEDNNIIKYIRDSKKIQVYLFYKLLEEQIKMWKKQQNIDLRNRYWILATLWNIWGREKANKNVDTWWAILKFLWYNIRFWDLANKIINSLEMQKIIIDLKNI